MKFHTKELVFSLVAAGALAATATPAMAIGDGMYGSAFAGVAVTPDVNGVEFDTGYNAGAAFGVKKNNFRYEAEATYMSSNVKSFSGDLSLNAGMANVFYDFDQVSQSITPYVGLGVGVARVRSAIDVNDAGTTLQLTQSETRFAYQGIAGAAYHINDKTALTADYRYFGTTKLDSTNKRFKNHLFNVGITRHFD